LELMNLSRREAVAMATINPARFLKIADRKGSLEVGKDADCVILDRAFKVFQTVVMGKPQSRGDTEKAEGEAC
jgi:N-acetylglucosamine-6-phosphate deacetylase